MRLGALRVLLLAAGVASVSAAQTVPAAKAGNLQLSAGAGFSGYDVDWGHGEMFGAAAWIDYLPARGPQLLQSLGLEIEARDISFHRNASQPSNFELNTLGGGPIYFVPFRFHNIQPYAKYIVNWGAIDWSPNPGFQHETRIVTAPGGGIVYRLFGRFQVRGDWEYQFWPGIAIHSPGGHVLDPQGYTVGMMYDLGRVLSR